MTTASLPTAPVAERRPHVLTHHGDERRDDWYWLRDRNNAAVIAYLEAENAYTDAVTAPIKPLEEQLLKEFVSRIQETDLSAPVMHGGFWYYHRTVEGLQYRIHCRKAGALDAAEHVLIDENEMAAGHEFFSLRGTTPSPDHRLLCYATNTDGTDNADIKFRDLGTGDDLPDVIAAVTGNVAWASDNRTLFYAHRDAALRPFQIWRHTLGTDRGEDVLVYQEDDERFRVSVARSRTGAFVSIHVRSSLTSETWLLPAFDPNGKFRVVEPRLSGRLYSVSHHGDDLFVLTNDDGAVNFKLMVAPVNAPSYDNWREFIPHHDDVRLQSVLPFREWLALSQRVDAVQRITVMNLGTGDAHAIHQPEAVSTAIFRANPEFDTATLRFQYTSMVTPSSIYDYDMPRRDLTLVKQEPVLGGYDSQGYVTERQWATAADGVKVPISIVRRKTTPVDGTAPALLYGYGSYESSTDPQFSPFLLSLLDRGVVYAIAHVRGGGEMGRQWYEDGRFLAKRNTFSDFIACAEHVVAAGYSAPDKLAARGGSAGGLLMGAVVNERPDLFKAVVAQVPFVDVVTTMLDETIPLTVPEWEEWGNPNELEFYTYMKSYSPYDNVRAQDYPALLVTTGLNDTRVAYWEPAKWVAKLRTLKTDSNVLLLKTELGAGHSGPSGRYNAWRELAFVYSFVLDQIREEVR